MRAALAVLCVVAFVVGLPQAADAITASPLVNPVSGRCLDVTGGSNADGTQVKIWTCTGGENQLWTSTSAGELRVTVKGATKCLSASGTANGAIVELWTCKAAADNNQRWAASAGTTTAVHVSGTAGGRVFDGVGAIGGDADSADGSEPSVQHVRGVVNCDVGYEFWLAKQAKARNPDIRLRPLSRARAGTWRDSYGAGAVVRDSLDVGVAHRSVTADHPARAGRSHESGWSRCHRRQDLTSESEVLGKGCVEINTASSNDHWEVESAQATGRPARFPCRDRGPWPQLAPTNGFASIPQVLPGSGNTPEIR
ncbi:hypothetical protein GCM10029964_086920 [Kibdelosporangium lantanae]